MHITCYPTSFYFYANIDVCMADHSPANPILKLSPTPNGHILYFFGARHANDPTDPQFDVLKSLWDEFISRTDTQRIVFVESVVREAPKQFTDAIVQRGEVGATLWLAHRDSVVAVCPEPDDSEQRRVLCAQFDPRDVAYTLIAQNLTSWGRRKVQTFDFKEAVERSLSREAKFADIYSFTPDATWFQEQHRKLFGEQPLEDKGFLDTISDPRRKDTLVNVIVAARSLMRNEYIAKRFSEAWNDGKNIFIVYGNGHLPVLETALHAMVEK